MAPQSIRMAKPGDLKPFPRNARTHSKQQIRQVADSIKEFGWTVPILVDGTGMIIAGHARVEAAKLLDLDAVPTISVDHLNEAQTRAYIIADNKLAENAGWDIEILAQEIEFLSSVEFDLPVIGFETAEIDLMLQGLAPEDDEAEEVPAVDETTPPVSKPGDLWLLGDHRLLCADATKAESFEQLMAAERAQMVFTDSPYNVPIDGHICGLGSIKHREFAMAAGEMSTDEFAAFLEKALGLMAAHSADGAIHFVCMDWRHISELLKAGEAVYTSLENLCVWNKTNGGMGSLYRSKHELVFVFKNGTAKHINNVELGRHGRNRTNVWDYPGVNSFGKNRDADLALHPTVKPVAMVADAILDCSQRGGIVLDAFTGSGTTLIAAERTGRRGYGLEIDPRYVDTAIRRWQTLTSDAAIHETTSRRFDDIETVTIEQKEEDHV